MEGENIDDLEQIIIVQLTSNGRVVIQRIGRSIRFKKGHIAKVIVLVVEKTADEKWYETAFADIDKSRIKVYKLKGLQNPRI